MSMNRDMRDFELDLFLNLGGHLDSHGNTRRNDTLKQAAESRAQSWPLEKSPRTATVSCPYPFKPFILSRSLFP